MQQTFNYIGLKYSQGKSAQELLSFTASANDIRAWGGIPTKTERFHGGFQRALSERYRKIIQYFDDGLSSPTSIVVAFREGALAVTELGYPAAWLSKEGLTSVPAFAHVSFTFDEKDVESDDLWLLAAEVCAMLKPRLDASGDKPASVSDLENGVEVDELDDPEADQNPVEDEDDDASLEIDVGQSKLKSFYDFLMDRPRVEAWLIEENAKYDTIKASKSKAKSDREFLEYTPEQRLKSSLVSLLKPAMIVDGQHRVMGAYGSANSPITFNVCAIKDANWIEQVFQFVVLNKLARPISSSFLTALLNTSLTNIELEEIEPRLETVAIKNTDRILMKYINFVETSPFFNMVAQPGDMAGADNSGKLSDKGMLRIAKRWYNLANSKKEIEMFLPAIGETGLTKGRAKWRALDTWSLYFYAFWDVLKEKYASDGVWEKRPRNNLLYIVTLTALQDLFLSKKADADSVFANVEDFKTQVAKFFENVPGAFFLNWEATGLQSGQGPEHIKNAVMRLRDGKTLGTVKDTSELFKKA